MEEISGLMQVSSEFEQNKAKLAELIESTEAFQYSSKEQYTLASGITTPFYFDLKKLNGDAKGINTVAKVFYQMIKEMKDVKSVGGLASGSISIATAISHLSYIENPNDPINSFYVRKEPKKYGSENRIEGRIKSPVVVVDDVITSGMSAISAVNAVKEAGFECKRLLSIVFRGNDKHKQEIEKYSEFEYLFHQDYFIEKFKEKNPDLAIKI